MNRIEIIRIRLARSNVDDVLAKLKDLASGLDKMDIEIYRHIAVDTDIAIHLLIQSTDSPSASSETGQHLASALKELGLVNHSVWVKIAKEDIDEAKKGKQL